MEKTKEVATSPLQRLVLLIACCVAMIALTGCLSYSRGYGDGYRVGRLDGAMNIFAELIRRQEAIKTIEEIKKDSPEFWEELKPYYFNEENQ